MANVKGKYVFDKAQFAVANFEYKGFTFTSNGQTFYGIRVRPYSEGATVCWLEYINEDGTYTTAAFQDGGWDTNWDYGDGYKTVDFGSGADIPDELETWLDASATHKVMILKAGTYRWNEVIDTTIYNNYAMATISLEYEANMAMGGKSADVKFYTSTVFLNNSGNENAIAYCYEKTEPDLTSFGFVYSEDNPYALYYEGAWVNFNNLFTNLDQIKTFTLLKDTEVTDVFGNIFIANTNYNEVNAKPLATIEYNGETIAQLNAGETATLSCKDKKMVSDVVVKVNEVESKIPEGYVKPEGSLPITENGTYPVADKEEVVVNVPIPDGYIKPEGSLPITENGTYPVTDKEEVVVDVPTTTDGVPVEMLNQAVMNELIAPNSTKGEVGAVYLYHGEASDTYEYGALYILEEVSE